MHSLGSFPSNMTSSQVLESIGENIILADEDYNVVWVNPKAIKLLTVVGPLFGIENVEDMIGMNMDRFHRNPSHQRRIMKDLSSPLRSRIDTKGQFVTDIVITPILDTEKEVSGYVVMLMDVTTKAQEEDRMLRLVNELSVPIIRIWENAVVIPVLGKLDPDHFELIVSKLLTYSVEHEIKYAFISFAGVEKAGAGTSDSLIKLNEMLRLIGTQCIVVGISATLALSLNAASYPFPTFAKLQQGIKYVLKQDKITL
ncbi:PAS domain-containing protein [Peribacillus cavernae]|uniref:PAS domain-containing protein n=1 Tax=Peribacillus cavernae TaxID=1674310 RepID=A0A433HHV7_9BACI|nr:PAS domain-containing protein [Peribacillus cavernae]MDQ0219288.1 anti-anti-sigma regulatory factor [Peribacillus cavernae]RUQ27825.1 PAS domain-containing protein [Peribacillus cavernae]